MKLALISSLVVIGGCATVEAPVISAHRVNAFRDVVQKAEAAGAADGPSEAATLLREAKSDFYYAQHLPANPAQAQEIAVQAQAAAERALSLASEESVRRLALHRPADQAPRTGETPAVAADETTSVADAASAPAPASDRAVTSATVR